MNEKSYEIIERTGGNSLKFIAIKGDITKMHTDAIVLPANTMLKEGPGASASIFKKAGRKELTADCKRLAPVEQGSAIPTSAYKLPSDFIIHAVVPKWKGGDNNEYDELCSAYMSSLSLADTMGLKSIAFPLLAAGHNRFDPRLAVSIAKTCIEEYHPTNLENTYLVIFDDTTKALLMSIGISVYEEELQNNQDKHNKRTSIQKQEILSKIRTTIPKAVRFINDHKEEIYEFLKLAKNAAKLFLK